MTLRVIARESRLAAALAGLEQTRSRSKEFPSTLLERQPRDHRLMRRDSTKPQAVIATVAAISQGKGTRGAGAAAGGGATYYGGGSGGGGFGGGGDPD